MGEIHDKESEAILNSLKDDFLVTDMNGVITRVTSSMKRAYDAEGETLVGRSVYELEEEGFFTPIVTPLVKTKQERVTVTQTTRTGKNFLVTGVPVYNDNGDLWRVATYSHDITELVKMRKHLEEIEGEMERVQNELAHMRHQYLEEHGFIAHSEEIKKCLETASRVAPTDVNVLLLGESGVGKTEVAKMIHKESSRADGPFIEVNCGAIPETLFEAELFGYEGGAFTGSAQKGKVGLAELAEGGTLFLDEVGELSLNHQVKVLKFIQEKQFYKVGGRKPIHVDFRLLSATNQPLEKRVSENQFREDLFYRLNVVPVRIPPLRERTADLIPLIEHFIKMFNEKYNRTCSLNDQVLQWLVRQPWPGNARELMNLLERLIVTAPSKAITTSDLPKEAAKYPNSPDPTKSLQEQLESFEAAILREAKQTVKTTTAMSDMLGISQPSVVRKLKKYNID
ncbi:transcriptional regulator with PAS, ATPase and Fis domain [Salsuginibacillus halophilus]|uniref:Transcriptional regulator with PAS, ATPase and Fis domain n=1 Tax=Salsuginibacillus halophilus TaxID=517424 RepID=A0A2P8HI16_9BACI|nr:sigma 54-interacting transcriptional regulator [Salsuginibacillus halophilus]PSL45858.1 transcriptional regulator with PAS, ATPase and Fis domain [Salsuginibacillus halophilus]